MPDSKALRTEAMASSSGTGPNTFPRGDAPNTTQLSLRPVFPSALSSIVRFSEWTKVFGNSEFWVSRENKARRLSEWVRVTRDGAARDLRDGNLQRRRWKAHLVCHHFDSSQRSRAQQVGGLHQRQNILHPQGYPARYWFGVQGESRETHRFGWCFYPMNLPLVETDLQPGIITVGGFQHSLKPTCQGLSLWLDYFASELAGKGQKTTMGTNEFFFISFI